MGGKIKKIEYCIEFDNYDHIFEDFVYYFNKIKEKGNDYKTFGKLMINSLYGRLGMREANTDSIIIKKEEYDIYYKKYKIIDFVEINDFLLIKIEISQEYKKNNKIPKTKNNISLASAITSKARIKLYNAQQSVIKNGGRVLYSDTDSIFAAYKRNVIDEKHGEIF
jgi:DNA polymerase elongation subunit (family B)